MKIEVTTARGNQKHLIEVKSLDEADLYRAVRKAGMFGSKGLGFNEGTIFAGFHTVGTYRVVDPPAPPPPVDSPVATDRGVPDRRSGRQDGGR